VIRIADLLLNIKTDAN